MKLKKKPYLFAKSFKKQTKKKPMREAVRTFDCQKNSRKIY